QQEIENLQREIRAERLISEQQNASLQQAELQYRQSSEAIVPARQRVSEVTRFLHNNQLAYSQLKQQIEQADHLQQRLKAELEELTLQNEELAARIEEFEIELESNQELLEQQREVYADLTVQLEKAN